MKRSLATFRRLDRHIYHRLEDGGRYALAEVIFLAMLPGFIGSLIGGSIALWFGVVLAIALLGILSWRICFVFRLKIRAADHHYEAVDKYRLSKEYWTESSTVASRRRSK